jgi:ankyrin repeat protein
VAAANGRSEIVELLIGAAGDVNKGCGVSAILVPSRRKEVTPLMAAAKCGDTAIVLRLLRAGADAKRISPVFAHHQI